MTDHDHDIVGYVLDALDPAERRAVEYRLAADPAAAAEADRVRAALARLAADREPAAPRPGLRVRTLARLAEDLVAHGPNPDAPAPAEPPAEPSERVTAPIPARGRGGWRFRFDIAATAAAAVVLVGLGVTWIGQTRREYAVAACQDNLRALHRGLAGYSDRHDGKFPQVGDGGHPTAGTFVNALAETGDVPAAFTPHCPAAGPRPGEGVQYSYALGYRGPGGELVGLRQSDPGGEVMPIAADYPAAGAAPRPGPESAHRRGHNVLYVGGHVRFATTPNVGPNGDDIFRNNAGRVAAGLTPTDAVLGRPDDWP